MAVYVICEAIVQFETQLGNIPFLATGHGIRNVNMDGGRRKWMPK